MESETHSDHGFLGQPVALFSGRLEGVSKIWCEDWKVEQEGRFAYRMNGLTSSLDVCHAFGIKSPKSVWAIILCMS